MLGAAPRRPSFRRRVLSLVLVVALVGGAGTGADAHPSRADTVRADTLTRFQAAPLTVTVLRTTLERSLVPAAVTLTDATESARRGPGLGLDDALRAIPGLQIENRYNYSLGERVSIRGFGARAQFGVRGIRALVDGIPATLADGQTALDQIDLAGLGRAEVLRGAASSLYGNAAGGVILLESAPPPAAPLRQEVRVAGGSAGLLRLESRTGGTVGRGWYGVELTRLRYDGYREHSRASNHYATARAGYRGERDDLRLVLRFVDLDAQNPGALSDSLLAVDRSMAFPNNIVQRAGKASSQLQVGGSWRRELDHGAVEVAAHALERQVENPTPPQIIDLDRRAAGARVVYQGARMGRDLAGPTADSNPPALRWTFGLEVDHQRDDRLNHRNLQGERGDLTLDQVEWVTGLGAFAQLAAPLMGRLTALGGIRYDHFHFRVRDHYIVAGDPDDSGRRTMAALSPSLGVVYVWGETSIYGNLGTSFQTPTTTELVNRPDGAGGFNPTLEPERTCSVELGVRGRFGQTTVGSPGYVAWTTFQLAVYHARTRHALIGFEVPSVPGRTFYRNAGSALHRGIELETTTYLADLVVLRLAYTLTDARFERYRVDGEELDGRRIPGVAPHRAEGGLSYLGRGWRGELWGRVVSRVPVDDRNSATSPGYTLVGVRLGGRGVRIGPVELEPSIGIDNLFDREYNTAVAINAFGGRYFEPGPGRTLFLGARVGVGGE